MSYIELPDIEAVAASALRTGNVCSQRVYSSIPANPTYPLAIVERLGGIPAAKEKLDAARIQVSVWGTTKAEARTNAELARRVLHATEGNYFGSFEAYVTGVADELGLTWLPDVVTHKDRYIFAVMIYAHTATIST